MATTRKVNARARDRKAEFKTEEPKPKKTVKRSKKKSGRETRAGQKAPLVEGEAVERTADAKSADIDEDEEEVEGGEVSRKDIVQNALRKVRSQLKREKVVTPATVGALEKLLKLDRDILKETEMPHEIRVLWEETDEDPEDDQ